MNSIGWQNFRTEQKFKYTFLPKKRTKICKVGDKWHTVQKCNRTTNKLLFNSAFNNTFSKFSFLLYRINSTYLPLFCYRILNIKYSGIPKIYSISVDCWPNVVVVFSLKNIAKVRWHLDLFIYYIERFVSDGNHIWKRRQIKELNEYIIWTFIYCVDIIFAIQMFISRFLLFLISLLLYHSQTETWTTTAIIIIIKNTMSFWIGMGKLLQCNQICTFVDPSDLWLCTIKPFSLNAKMVDAQDKWWCLQFELNNYCSSNKPNVWQKRPKEMHFVMAHVLHLTTVM